MRLWRPKVLNLCSNAILICVWSMELSRWVFLEAPALWKWTGLRLHLRCCEKEKLSPRSGTQMECFTCSIFPKTVNPKWNYNHGFLVPFVPTIFKGTSWALLDSLSIFAFLSWEAEVEVKDLSISTIWFFPRVISKSLLCPGYNCDFPCFQSTYCVVIAWGTVL